MFRRLAAMAVFAVLALALVLATKPAPTSAAVTCPNANPVVNENQCKGAGTTGWKLQSYDAIAVAGFPTKTSVNIGSPVTLKAARSNGTGPIDIRVYRMGYYGGTGGRLVHSVDGVQVTNGINCNDMNATTGLEDCGNWHDTYTIPASALPATGVYIVRLIDEQSNHDNQAIFTVRDDNRSTASPILLKLPTSTYQAYNQWTGKSLYTDLSQGANTISGSKRAVKVSFDRPLDGVFNQNNWFLKADYPLVSWLERQGYDVSYTDSVAVHQDPAQLKKHKAVVLSGHDEYWSGEELHGLKAARDAGVNIASFSANTAYWKVRYEDAGKTLVDYKTVEGAGPTDGTTGANDWGPDGVKNTADDALGADRRAGTSDDHPENSTTSWRDNGAAAGDPNAPPEGRVGPDEPENSLFGTMFNGLNGGHDYTLTIPAANGANEYAGDSIWRNTGISSTSSTTIASKLTGFEWDTVPTQAQYTSRQPAGVKRVSASPTQDDPGAQYIQDEGRLYGTSPPPGLTDAANAVRYTAPSGAKVFAAGTNIWSWGLGPHYENASNANYSQPASDTSDDRVQQATYNLLSDEGVEPGTPDGVVTGVNHAPTASFTATPNPAQTGQTVTFNGSGSSDSDGTIVKYEWDLDGNGSFETSTGTTATTSRIYTGSGDYDVRLRVTDSGGARTTTTKTVTVTSTASTYADAVLATGGLRNYWRLGETAGTAFADSKGGSTATTGGGPSLGVPGAISGDPDKAARFDGTNDFAQAAVDFSDTKTLSLEFWSKWNAFANDDKLAFELTPNFNTNDGALLVDPDESGSGRFELAHRQGAAYHGYNNGNFARPSAGQWHHYVLEFDKTQAASGELKAYVDGGLASLTKPASAETYDTFAKSTLYFMSRAGSSLFGGGDLDEVATYDRALSAGTVSNHYLKGVGGGAGNTAPNAAFTISPNPAQVGQTVNFNGSGSNDPDGTISTYEWDLDGNGTYETNTGSTATVSKTYTGSGDFNVKLRVTDNRGGSGTVAHTLTIQPAGAGSYSADVLGTAGLRNYWRLGETAGTAFADSKGSSPATALGGVTLGVPGAIAGDPDKAARFDGVDDSASAAVGLADTGTVSLEFWLKWNAFANDDRLAFELTPNFNTNAGGFLVDPNESSSGKFEFTERQGAFYSGYNAGRLTRPSSGLWHHYVLELDKTAPGANELTGYVDGQAVALDRPTTTDTVDTFANATLYFMSRAGGSLFGAGDLDEVAAYDRVLSPATVLDHYQRGAAGGNQPPNAAFTATPNPVTAGDTVTYNASTSTDSDGTITKYQWDLDGNGSYETDTGTTPTASKLYTTAGSVSVGLKVTDNGGATGTTTKTVTVNSAPSSSYSGTVLGTTGLRNYWRLGETAGTSFADAKGGVPATAVGGPLLGVPGAIAGDPDKAARFDGVNDFAFANLNLSDTSTVSLEFWLKWNANANDDRLAFELTPNFNTNPGGFLVDPDESASGQFEFTERQGSAFTGYNAARFARRSATAWHHYVLVFDKTAAAGSELAAYVDGQPVTLARPFTTDNIDAFAQSALYFMSRGGSALFGAGDLDDVALYGRALTSAEALTHYQRGTGP